MNNDRMHTVRIPNDLYFEWFGYQRELRELGIKTKKQVIVLALEKAVEDAKKLRRDSDEKNAQ